MLQFDEAGAIVHIQQLEMLQIRDVACSCESRSWKVRRKNSLLDVWRHVAQQK
jgi:hypothetical protein